MYCPNCDSEVKGLVRHISESYPVKGENISILAKVRVCECCNEIIWDEELDSQNLLNAFAEYREKHNLLQPEEIRAVREKYGLSQVSFARVLGFGDKTITRYENGSIPDAAQNNVMLLVKQPHNFEILLEQNKSRISPSDYATARACLERILTHTTAYKYVTKKTYYNIIPSFKFDVLVDNEEWEEKYA